MAYQDLQGDRHYDFNWSISQKTDEVRYRKSIPSLGEMHFGKKKVGTERNNLRGKTCPACGLKRSMANKCECNS